jgi:hypothetical protein
LGIGYRFRIDLSVFKLFFAITTSSVKRFYGDGVGIDMRLKIVSNPLLIVYAPQFLRRIAAFAAPVAEPAGDVAATEAGPSDAG